MKRQDENKLGRVRWARVIASSNGMTIVELMIVLTIIASIMGVVGFFVFGALDTASNKEAKIEIAQLSNMVDAYYLAASPRKLPDSLEDLTKGPAPLTEEVPKDPWGNDYIFKKSSNREYEIYSAGADGQEGTEDDVHEKDNQE